jgi:hypothetical protein
LLWDQEGSLIKPPPNQVFNLTFLILFDLESDGLLAVIDLKSKNRENFPSQVVFNQTGDSLLIADSRT